MKRAIAASSDQPQRKGRHERARLSQSAPSNPELAGERPTLGPSSLVNHLLRRWSLGELSSTAIQATAQKAYEDQVELLTSLSLSIDMCHPDLYQLAKLGDHGRTTSNIHSQLRTYLGTPSTPPTHVHQVPVLAKKVSPESTGSECILKVPYSIMLPHVMFSWYYQHDRSRFNRLFLGGMGQADIANFWRTLEARGDPRLADHPMRSKRRWREFAVPIAVHGDAVPVLQVGKSGSKSFDAYSLQSLFASGTTLNIKLLMMGIFTSSLATGDEQNSMRELWRITTWSLHWLAMGVWPEVDWFGKKWTASHPAERDLAGKKLADGFFGCVYSLKGDLEQLSLKYKLRHFNANQMCDLCPAHRDETDRPFLYCNFDRDAQWPKALYTSDEWRKLYEGKFIHYLFRLGGVTQHCIEPDELHVLYLGVCQYF